MLWFLATGETWHENRVRSLTQLTFMSIAASSILTLHNCLAKLVQENNCIEIQPTICIFVSMRDSRYVVNRKWQFQNNEADKCYTILITYTVYLSMFYWLPLNHCDIVTTYGDVYLGQHRLHSLHVTSVYIVCFLFTHSVSGDKPGATLTNRDKLN